MDRRSVPEKNGIFPARGEKNENRFASEEKMAGEAEKMLCAINLDSSNNGTKRIKDNEIPVIKAHRTNREETRAALVCFLVKRANARLNKTYRPMKSSVA